MTIGERIGSMLDWMHLRPHAPVSAKSAEAEAAVSELRAAHDRRELSAFKALAADARLVTANTRVQAFVASVFSEARRDGQGPLP